MLEKFISIKNIGRFRDCSARGDVSLRKLSLFFAENGQGKTTLCAILRSLQNGRYEYISERKTVGVSDPCSINIRLDGNTISYSNDSWSITYPNIAIFDSVFVNENVYAGDYIEHDHKKNLYRVIVGAQGVQLSKDVDDLNKRIQEANREIRIKKDSASKYLPNGIKLEAYISWQSIDDIEDRIKKKSDEIAKQQHALDKAGEIQTRGILSKIELPTFPFNFTDVLAKKLDDVAEDAEAQVRQQVTQHEMGHQGEDWLSRGLRYIKDEKCPFCGQNIRINNLIKAYRSHFNAAYNSLKKEVTELNQQIISTIGESVLNKSQQTISGNLTLMEFWKQFAEVVLPDFPINEIKQKYARLQEMSLALAKKKQQHPTEAVSLDASFSSSLKDIESLKPLVESYNKKVDAFNKSINAIKSSIQKGKPLDSLKKQLADLISKKKRFKPEVVKACQEYQHELKAKEGLENRKRIAKEKLDQYCEAILVTYEKSINGYLDQFNAGFRIINTKHRYTGGSPSSHFQIAINDCPINLGDSRTPVGTPCFKTTLSAGDRSALGLAFFLASLRQNPQINDMIVVLDDPFTSLDRFRRTCTQQLIGQFTNIVRQVIILSHDPHFLKLLWDEYPGNNVKSLQMSKAGDTVIIGEWDIVAETQGGYLKDYSTLLDFYRERKGDPRSVVRSIRPFLEGMLRNHFPGHFLPNEWLGDFINKIRVADPSNGLSHAQADLLEFESINGYSKNYHHEQNPNCDDEPLSPDELYGYVKRTLRLVGGA